MSGFGRSGVVSLMVVVCEVLELIVGQLLSHAEYAERNRTAQRNYTRLLLNTITTESEPLLTLLCLSFLRHLRNQWDGTATDTGNLG